MASFSFLRKYARHIYGRIKLYLSRHKFLSFRTFLSRTRNRHKCYHRLSKHTHWQRILEKTDVYLFSPIHACFSSIEISYSPNQFEIEPSLPNLELTVFETATNPCRELNRRGKICPAGLGPFHAYEPHPRARHSGPRVPQDLERGMLAVAPVAKRIGRVRLRSSREPPSRRRAKQARPSVPDFHWPAFLQEPLGNPQPATGQ